jgi:hypothetical protein
MELHFNASGADRRKLVEAISKELNIKAKYLGMPSAAYEIGNYTVSKDGCLSFDDSTDIVEQSRVIDACVMAGFEPEEWAQNEESEAPEAEMPKEAEETTDSEDLGLTVAMPRESFTEGQLENLKKLVEAKAPLLKSALLVDDLPIEITDEKVSFPWFSGDIDAEHCGAYTSLITAICKMAKEAKRVTAKEKEAVNAKYEFRCFLLRLGFIGDEFKINRKLLLENLSGSSAFKSGAKKGGEA